MRYGITGATGLLGGNLAQVLLAAGHDVVATKRSSSKIDHHAKFPINWVEAPLNDIEALSEAFEGCDGIFHCAAAVSVILKVEDWLYEANVTGTENIITVVKNLKIPRLLHCSTVGAVGLSTDGQLCDENTEWNMPEFGLGDAYVTTKREAEELVMKAVAAGLNAVVVNPTYMIGPYDSKPSSGKLVSDLILGKVPSKPPGKNNFVDVRDVAKGMLLAMEKGRTGERYILGGWNMHYKDFMAKVCELTRSKPVRFQAPNWLANLFGFNIRDLN